MGRKLRRVKIVFRILGLSQKQVSCFQKEVAAARHGFTTGRLYRKPSVSTTLVELEEGRQYGDLVRFLRKNKIKKSNVGIWVSLITPNDTGGVHVPEFVMKLYEKTGGSFDFSFTCG